MFKRSISVKSAYRRPLKGALRRLVARSPSETGANTNQLKMDEDEECTCTYRPISLMTISATTLNKTCA